MTHDPVIILEQVRQIDERFQALMAYVRSAEAQTSTAYEVELRLFRSLLALGAQLLTLFFMHRAATDPAPVTLEGRPLRPHGWRETTYFSVFGLVRFRRRYYRTPEGKGCCPLDAALSLPRRRYSDLLRDWLGVRGDHRGLRRGGRAAGADPGHRRVQARAPAVATAGGACKAQTLR